MGRDVAYPIPHEEVDTCTSLEHSIYISGQRRHPWRSKTKKMEEWVGDSRAGNRLHWGGNPEVMLKWGGRKAMRDIRASQGHQLRGGCTAEAILGSQEGTTHLEGFCESGFTYDSQTWSAGRKLYLKMKQNQEKLTGSNNQNSARWYCGSGAGTLGWV